MKMGGSRSLKVGLRRAGVVSCSSSLSVSAAKLLRRSTGEGVDLAAGLAVFLGRENSSSSSLEGSGWDSSSLEWSASDSEGVLDLSEGVLGLDWAWREKRGKTLCLNRIYSSLLSLIALLLIADFAGCCPIRVGVSHVRYTVIDA